MPSSQRYPLQLIRHKKNGTALVIPRLWPLFWLRNALAIRSPLAWTATTSSGTGTVTLPAHIYRPMCRDTYCYPFSLSPSSVPMGSYSSASGNLLGSISIWPTTLRQSGLPRRHNPAIALRVTTFNGSPPTHSSRVALGVGFGFPSIGRQAVLPTHNEKNSPQLYQQKGFLSLETGNYSTPNPTEVRLNQVIPRAGPLPCVSVTSSYGATKSLSRPCIPFELLSPRRVILFWHLSAPSMVLLGLRPKLCTPVCTFAGILLDFV
jgi:hypothetical protein